MIRDMAISDIRVIQLSDAEYRCACGGINKPDRLSCGTTCSLPVQRNDRYWTVGPESGTPSMAAQSSGEQVALGQLLKDNGYNTVCSANGILKFDNFPYRPEPRVR